MRSFEGGERACAPRSPWRMISPTRFFSIPLASTACDVAPQDQVITPRTLCASIPGHKPTCDLPLRVQTLQPHEQCSAAREGIALPGSLDVWLRRRGNSLPLRRRQCAPLHPPRRGPPSALAEAGTALRSRSRQPVSPPRLSCAQSPWGRQMSGFSAVRVCQGAKAADVQ
jgi:hypothetical protein